MFTLSVPDELPRSWIVSSSIVEFEEDRSRHQMLACVRRSTTTVYSTTSKGYMCIYIYVEKERKERTKAREYRRSLATLTIILSNRKCVSSHTLNEYENELTTMRKMREKYEE